MILKTKGLYGEGLDYAVAIADGWKVTEDEEGTFWIENGTTLWLSEFLEYFKPRKNYHQSCSIIEREKISIHFGDPIDHDGEPSRWFAKLNGYTTEGSTFVEAALRVYVVSKLGYDIDIPIDLTEWRK